MKNSKGKAGHRPVRIIVAVVCVLTAVLLLAKSQNFSLRTLTELGRENPQTAAAVLWVLYALKSATVFFPLVVLEITSGHLFPTQAALAVNLAGMFIILTVPYWIGRAAGEGVIQRLVHKYPRFEAILDKQQESSLFLCFFLRIISCLPGDVVTMYLGATGTSFAKNLLGGIFGVLPGMVLATLVGESIRDPASPMFWLSIGGMVLLSAASLLLYAVYRRKHKKKESP